jgi:hypothetical protein
MGPIQPDMLDEIRKSVDRELGGDSNNWKQFNVQDVMSRLISTVGSRVLFGFPLCRNNKFLHAVDKFILYMGIGTIVIGKGLPWKTQGNTYTFLSGQLPPILIRPIIGSLLRLPVGYYKNQIVQELAPVIKERLIHLKETGDDPMLEESPDFLTQSIKKAIETRNDGDEGIKYLLEQFSLLVGLKSITQRIQINMLSRPSQLFPLPPLAVPTCF